MEDFKFSLSTNRLHSLFPFFIIVNESLCITGIGKSLGKLLPALTVGSSFANCFSVTRPSLQNPSYYNLLEILGQPILLAAANGILLRGQFEKIENSVFFAGTPSVSSLEQATKLGLTPNDFASYDAQPDLLHMLRDHEINTERLKDMLSGRQPNDILPGGIKLTPAKRSTNKEGVVFMRPNGKIFWCNDAYLTLSGYTREDLIDKTPEQMRSVAPIEKEDMDRVLGYLSKGEPYDITLKRRRKDGSTFWTRTKGQPIFNEEGVVTQYLTLVEDLTPQREKDEQLSLLSLIAEKNINPVIVCDNKGRIEWVSSNFMKTTGYSKDEVIGRRPGALLEGPETDPQTSMYIKTQAQKGLPVSAEILNYTKTGQKHWIKLHGQALHDKDGEVLKYYTIREDITDRKLMESQREELLKDLARSNGELEDYAQIVSHDLKSPLHSIHSLISWIKEDNSLAGQSLQYFGMIEGKLQMMHDLIQGVLTHSRIGREDIIRETIDVYDVVTEVIAMVHVPSNIKINIENKLPVLQADRFRILQLFRNLIANAVAAVDRADGLICISSQEQKNYFVFCIKDNGPALPEEYWQKMLTKFSSFAANDKPAGMGLSIIRKIVEHYKGELWVESDRDDGTAFYVKLYK